MKKVISYVLLILWMIVIFMLSHQSGDVSGGKSISILYNIFNFIFELFNLDISKLDSFINIIHEPLREFMHTFEYFILGILVMNLLSNYNIKNIVIVVIMICFIYSITDELHQLFIEGRTLQYFDLFMDFIGYVLSSFTFYKLTKKEVHL